MEDIDDTTFCPQVLHFIGYKLNAKPSFVLKHKGGKTVIKQLAAQKRSIQYESIQLNFNIFSELVKHKLLLSLFKVHKYDSSFPTGIQNEGYSELLITLPNY